MNVMILFDGVEVEYSVSGKGRPVVLVHGYLEAKEIWKGLSQKLEKNYKVISVDLPGHGASGVSGETHTMEYLADVVREVIVNAGERKVLLIGHSLGGYVALAFVHKYPEMLSGYVLFHSHPNSDSPEAITKRDREITVVKAGKKDLMYPANIAMMFARQNLESMPEELAGSKAIASLNPADGIIALLNGMIVRPSRISVVESGRVPLLWILGRWDLYFSPEKALGSVNLPDNAEVVILENSGHLGFIEETDLSARLIDEFAGNIGW